MSVDQLQRQPISDKSGIVTWQWMQFFQLLLAQPLSLDLPVYANNAAATAGGLQAGQLYRTSADPALVCVVT